ncbi:MAG: translation initiation factor IF-2, partial [Actinomycetota bacterium]
MASRVYELAEELKLSSREVIAALANLGVVARSHSSNVDDPAADKLRKAQQEGSLAQLTKAAAARPARPARPSRPSRTAAAPAAATEKAPAAQTAKPDPKSSAARQAAASTAAPAPSRPPASNKATDVASIDEVISGPKPNQSQRLPKPGESGVREVKRPPRTARPAAPRPSAERTARPAAARPSAERSRPGRGRPAAFVDQNQPPPPPRKKRAPDKAIVDELTVPRGITVSELSSKLGIPANEIIKKLFLLGQVYTMSQSLDDDAAELIASEFGCELTIVSPEDDLEADEVIEDDPADLKPRPPVITVMGHVDHGKTLLLDAIREADVVSTEHGGITQHIGAYQIHKNDRAITFIDTPGHEAFTQMRARGAQVTDIAVLVVAADDGVKPQTVEALNHAKAADVPIVVAVNKIDKPEADPQRPRQQLTEHELVPEEWGGETPFVDVSAKQGTNIDDLLDVLLLVADIKELKANPDAPARGSVIEAHLDKGRGPVATVLVNRGTLKIGDSIVCGGAWAKVRAMFDDTGSKMTQAGPGSPAQV